MIRLQNAATATWGNPSYSLTHMDYDAYWKARAHTGMRPRFPIIASFINHGASVLDVGCGDGAMLEYLKQTREIAELGIDVSPVAVEKARARSVRARVQLLSELAAATEQHPADHSAYFDHVIMSEVIEHVPNPEDFVQWGWQLARHSLILSFPNIAYLPHRLRLLFGRFPLQWAFHPGEHLRYWSLYDFKHWLAQLRLPGAYLVPIFRPSNGIMIGGLYQVCPNLCSNQIVVCIPRTRPLPGTSV